MELQRGVFLAEYPHAPAGRLPGRYKYDSLRLARNLPDFRRSGAAALGKRQGSGRGRKSGVNDGLIGVAAGLLLESVPSESRRGARDGRCGLRMCHGRGVRPGGSHRPGGESAVTAENVVGLIVAVALLGYLVLALIFPERF